MCQEHLVFEAMIWEHWYILTVELEDGVIRDITDHSYVWFMS